LGGAPVLDNSHIASLSLGASIGIPMDAMSMLPCGLNNLGLKKLDIF
jgi:hypothetical protein